MLHDQYNANISNLAVLQVSAPVMFNRSTNRIDWS